MKKVLVLLIAFAIVGGATLFAATIDSGSLEVTGLIPSPAKNVTLDVFQTLSTPINLIENSDVQIGGDGVLVGNWKVSTENHEGNEGYKITYSYGPLVSVTTQETLDFVITEYENSTETDPQEGEAMIDGASSTFTAQSGTKSVTNYLRINLTESAVGLIPTNDFKSTITLDLANN